MTNLTSEQSFCKQWVVYALGGVANLTISRFYSGIRIQGTYTPTSLSTNDIIFKSSNFYINGATTIPDYPNNQLYTFCCMIKDNSGSLPQGTLGYCAIFNHVTNSVNTYHFVRETLSRNWKRVLRIVSIKARFKPGIRIHFNLSKIEPINIDISIKNICLYEGAFVNPPYVQDYLSRIGTEEFNPQDEVVERNDGYLLSNTLPAHAREFIINNNGSKEWFDYDRDKNVVLLSYSYSSAYIHHIVKGSLYHIPAVNYTTALRKWDIFVWMRCSNGTWGSIYNTCVEDTSYRKQTSTYDYNNNLYKLVVKSGYINNSYNNYIGLSFHGSRVGNEPMWSNAISKLIFVPEIMNSSTSQIMEWIHIDKSMYNPNVGGTFVESA